MEKTQATATGGGDKGGANSQGGMDSTDAPGTSEEKGATVGQGVDVVSRTEPEWDCKADCYNMNHKIRGKAIIFNNKTVLKVEEREGTDVDVGKMFMVLTEMGFSVDILANCSIAQIKSTLVETAKEDHSQSDCFACVILTQEEMGLTCDKDKSIEIDDLVAPFKGHKCQALAGKPKLFFIQACRGSGKDAGVDVADNPGIRGKEKMDVHTVRFRKIPTEADFLMAYSTVPGFLSWRGKEKGSFFIRALAQVLQNNWKYMDLMRMMTRVCRKVAYDFESTTEEEETNKMKQIPCIMSMLTRDVYFNHGNENHNRSPFAEPVQNV